MDMVQTQLKQGTTFMTTWLPRDNRVKPGTRLTLKGESGIWTVAQQHSTIDLAGINRGWNNNI